MKDINLSQFVYSFLKIDLPKKNPPPVDRFNVDPYSLESMLAQQDDIQKSIQQEAAKANREINPAKAQLAQLNNSGKTVLLKELLNLPKDLKDFVLMMSTNTEAEVVDTKQLMNLLMTNSMDLSKLAEFVQQNGKEALSKLFQMIASFNQLGTSIKSSQLSELAAVINACVSTAGEKPSQLLKNIMLLYLPWLPVGDQNAFKLEIADANGGESGSADDSITILISTVNFGNIQAVLNKPDKNSINIFITCSNEFPAKEIEKALKIESTNYNVQTGILVETKDSLTKEFENAKTQVSMNVSPGVNPFLILMAGSVIKIIIALDNSDSLRQTRKEML